MHEPTENGKDVCQQEARTSGDTFSRRLGVDDRENAPLLRCQVELSDLLAKPLGAREHGLAGWQRLGCA